MVLAGLSCQEARLVLSLSDSYFILFGMSATASDSSQYQPVDTNGLEDLFRAGTTNECQVPVPTNAELIEEPVVTCAEPEPVPVEEAALTLGVSLNALKKQLRKGAITGFKRQTKHGEKWFVDSTSLQNYGTLIQGFANQRRPVLTNAELVEEPVADNSAQVLMAANECQAQVPASAELIEEPVATCAEPEPVPVDKHLEVIQDLQRKIEVLTYRNGYLEAQLEAEREQVKLLTDSQHKLGWWTKFCSWFMGQRA